MQTIEEYKAYTQQLEGEVIKWHHAYDTLVIERNALVRKMRGRHKERSSLLEKRTDRGNTEPDTVRHPAISFERTFTDKAGNGEPQDEAHPWSLPPCDSARLSQRRGPDLRHEAV